jgi:NAD(P)-dependent dehydrogenase (short-subunit alcohol dehydrogenase family)
VHSRFQNPAEIAGKTVMVTGGGRGLGRAFVHGFLQRGARVAIFTRSEPPLLDLLDEERARSLLIVGDVTSQVDVQRAVDETTGHFGGIDVLVNNAGINRITSLLEADFREWARVVDVNLTGLALCTHRVLTLMVKARFGRIINIVSRSAEDPVATRTAYSASKAGVIAFTRALAMELEQTKDCDILANGLIPGPTRTSMHQSDGQDPELVFPFCLQLATLPAGGPNGRFFRKGLDYAMFEKFNFKRGDKKRYSGMLPSWLRR